MWKRRKRARRAVTSPIELCDLCAATFPAGEAVREYVPDSSSAHATRDWCDGLRLLTACREEHLEELREAYRRRPFVQEELWAAKISRALTAGPPALTLTQLACRTGLHAPEIRRAIAWHNRHRPTGNAEPTDL